MHTKCYLRAFKNSKHLGVRFPFNQPMKVYSSLWNAYDWDTRGRLVYVTICGCLQELPHRWLSVIRECQLLFNLRQALVGPEEVSRS
ncbi:hypothetical protein R6Q59_012019 [Mikania micrantha]